MISETISEVIDELDESPRKINSGRCQELALAVQKRESSAWAVSWLDIVPWDRYGSTGSQVFGSHTWVVDFRRQHYDAERPAGVDNWWELPFFKRAIEQSAYESHVPILIASHTERR